MSAIFFTPVLNGSHIVVRIIQLSTQGPWLVEIKNYEYNRIRNEVIPV